MTTQKYKECADAYVKRLANYENFSIKDKIDLYLAMTNKNFTDLVKQANIGFYTLKRHLEKPEDLKASEVNKIIENTDGFFVMEDFIKKN